MKSIAALEEYRVKSGPLASDATEGNNGVFEIPIVSESIGHNRHRLTVSRAPVRRFKNRRVPPRILRIMVSDGNLWDHVSVSLPDRCPTWDEMNLVKNLFWSEEETVMQLHPPVADYVNNCKTCLHLWKPQDKEIPRPPTWMVGFRGDGEPTIAGMPTI